MESMEDIVNAKGNLSLSSMKVGVNLDVDVVYWDSRAESEIDLSNYIVTIYDKYSQRGRAMGYIVRCRKSCLWQWVLIRWR